MLALAGVLLGCSGSDPTPDPADHVVQEPARPRMRCIDVPGAIRESLQYDAAMDRLLVTEPRLVCPRKKWDLVALALGEPGREVVLQDVGVGPVPAGDGRFLLMRAVGDPRTDRGNETRLVLGSAGKRDARLLSTPSYEIDQVLYDPIANAAYPVAHMRRLYDLGEGSAAGGAGFLWKIRLDDGEPVSIDFETGQLFGIIEGGESLVASGRVSYEPGTYVVAIDSGKARRLEHRGAPVRLVGDQVVAAVARDGDTAPPEQALAALWLVSTKDGSTRQVEGTEVGDRVLPGQGDLFVERTEEEARVLLRLDGNSLVPLARARGAGFWRATKAGEKRTAVLVTRDSNEDGKLDSSDERDVCVLEDPRGEAIDVELPLRRPSGPLPTAPTGSEDVLAQSRSEHVLAVSPEYRIPTMPRYVSRFPASSVPGRAPVWREYHVACLGEVENLSERALPVAIACVATSGAGTSVSAREELSRVLEPGQRARYEIDVGPLRMASSEIDLAVETYVGEERVPFFNERVSADAADWDAVTARLRDEMGIHVLPTGRRIEPHASAIMHFPLRLRATSQFLEGSTSERSKRAQRAWSLLAEHLRRVHGSRTPPQEIRLVLPGGKAATLTRKGLNARPRPRPDR